MTRDWRVVALLAGVIALVAIGVVLLTHHAESKPALVVSLPEGVDIYAVLPDAKDLAFQRFP